MLHTKWVSFCSYFLFIYLTVRSVDNCSLEYFFGTSKSLIDFGAELEELSNEQCLKKDRNESVKYDLSTSFKNVYQGEFRVVLYGSRASGLATRDSADLDILFDTSRSNNVPINNIERENWMLNKIAKFMKNKGGGKWSNMEKIFCCRRPILKVTHAPTQMHCDITVMSSLGVSNTQMMSLYVATIRLRTVLTRFFFQIYETYTSITSNDSSRKGMVQSIRIY